MEDIITIVRAIPAWSWALGCLLIAAIGLVYWWGMVQADLRERVLMAIWQLQLEHRQSISDYTTSPNLYQVYQETRFWGSTASIARVQSALTELVRRGLLVSVESVPQVGRELTPTTYSLPHRVSH